MPLPAKSLTGSPRSAGVGSRTTSARSISPAWNTTVAPTRTANPEYYLNINDYTMALPRASRVNWFTRATYDLTDRIQAFGDFSYYHSKSDLVRSCGYVSTKKDGSERLNFTAFYEALLSAKGVSLAEGGGSKGKGGRKLSYVATVQGNGNLLVGKAYTAMLDLKPGDEFEIKLGRKQIKLIPAGASEEE